MLKMRQKPVIYRQTFDDGLGRTFSVEVPVIATECWDKEDHRWLECFDSAACNEIDGAIEKAYPGWFHTCGESPKQHCKACARQKAKDLTRQKDVVN